MVGTNEDDEMLSNARNARFKFLGGEGDRFARGLWIRDDPDEGAKNSCLWI